jgi:hypothetical protein
MLPPPVCSVVKKLTRQVVRPTSPIKRHRLNSFRPRLEALEDRTAPSTVNWVGGTGDWSVASNWLDATNMTNHVPTAADDAVIDGDGTVTHSTGTDLVQSIQVSSGTLELTGGTLRVSGTLAGDGAFTLRGGTLANADVAMGITFTNSGTLSGVTLSADQDLAATTSSVTLTNGLSLDSASILLGNAAGSTTGMLIINGTQTLGGSGSIVFGGSNSNLLGSPGAFTLTLGPDIVLRGKNGQVNIQGFVNQGTLSADTAGGTITINATHWSNLGTIEAQNGGTIFAQGTATNFSAGTLTGGTWQVFADSTLRLINTGIVTNAATILLDGANSNFYRDAGTTGALANLATNAAAGSFTIQNGASLTTAGTLTNAGNVSIDATSALAVGDSFIQTDGSTTLDGTLTAPTVVDVQGGTLSGTGTITGNLQNEASILIGSDTAAGTLTVSGNYSQSATGNLTVKVGGPSAGTDFDQLVVGGAATLDGTLTITLVNGFLPDSGTTYAVVTLASATGTFATLDGDGPLFTAAYNPMDVTLSAN